MSGFDIIYALQDESFDKQQQLHSIPVWMGRKNALHFSSFLHFVAAFFVIWAGIQSDFNWLYWIGATVFMGLLIYQHLIVSPTNLSKVNLAFFTTNGIASVVFAVFVIGDIFSNILP